jgi:hypothetical protein
MTTTAKPDRIIEVRDWLDRMIAAFAPVSAGAPSIAELEELTGAITASRTIWPPLAACNDPELAELRQASWELLDRVERVVDRELARQVK